MHTLEDPLFGVHYIDAIGFASVDAIGFLAMFSATVGQSMRRFIRYMPTFTNWRQVDMSVENGVAHFTSTPWGPPRLGRDQCVEMFAAGFILLAARMSGAPVEVLSLDFTHQPAPSATPEMYTEWLGRLPRFGAEQSSWSFAEEVLERPMLRSDPTVASFFEKYVRSKVGVALEEPFEERVKEATRMILAGGARLGDVAVRLSMSERTLQRRLAEQRLSFAEIASETRRVAAEKYLRAGRTVAEVSRALGYGHTGAFQRAFKTWTGRTPAEWRAMVTRR